MAKAPTLGTWELELLRTIERVVRLGHMKSVTEKEIILDGGAIALDPGSLVVHCAASGLRYPPMVRIWQPDKIRLQTIRAGSPCFGSALAGLVEATRDDDRERNRLCSPNVFSDSPASWVQMQVRGTLATRTFGAEPDIDAWANGCALNPARETAEQRKTSTVQDAVARLTAVADRGLSRASELAKRAIPLNQVGVWNHSSIVSRRLPRHDWRPCYERRLLRPMRISLIRRSGCSRAAKWPPFSVSP